LRLFSFGGCGLALAALALVVFGAYDSYPNRATLGVSLGSVKQAMACFCHGTPGLVGEVGDASKAGRPSSSV